jgi:hypothetical protein
MSRGTRVLALTLLCGVVAIGVAFLILGIIPPS